MRRQKTESTHTLTARAAAAVGRPREISSTKPTWRLTRQVRANGPNSKTNSARHMTVAIVSNRIAGRTAPSIQQPTAHVTSSEANVLGSVRVL